ncbi:carotenoid biosynthesis protein [bacterium]|nr:MAG: carotenoid biosynthesis protein [bacterium]
MNRSHSRTYLTMNLPQFSPKSRRALLFGVIFLFINGFFVAKVREATRPEYAGISAAFVLVLWAPSAWVLKQWLGWKRAAVLLAVLGLFAVFIETFAIKTGLPYGQFEYRDKIGSKVFGLVPWTVPFSWPPLVLGAIALASRIAPKRLLLATTLILLSFDFVLDPGAVQQEFWVYKSGGFYYGVPLSNFFGWLISGFIGAWLFQTLSGDKEEIPMPLVSSVMLILGFWTSVCLFVSMWIPAAVGIGLLGWIWKETEPQPD